jgi:hypothetical protein
VDERAGPGSETPAPAPCFWHRAAATGKPCHGCGRAICDACAAAVTIDDPPQSVAVCPTCAPLFGVPSSVPFEHPGGFTGFWRTWGRVLARPQALFTAFPRQGIGRPTVFAYLTWLPVAVVVSTCLALLILALSGLGHSSRGDTGVAMVVTVSVAWGIFGLTPLIVLAVALPLQVALLMARGEAGFVATYRLLAYLAGLVAVVAPLVIVGAPIVESALPGGSLAVLAGAEVWHAWALYHAVRRVHGLRPGPAVAAALVPLFVRGLLFGGLLVLTLLPW